nr:DNA cytosine methyltransferase [Microbacterium sp. Ag1]
MPKLLDLFSCAGGAGMGYHRAGFEVVGVDIRPQPNYPFEHHVGDAIEFVREHGHEFDAIHASPPCQAYSITRHMHTKDHPDLVEPTRAALIETGRPWIMENVPGAPMLDYVTLCGSMFGLTAVDTDGELLALRRHRLFESNVFMLSAGSCVHDRTRVAGVYGGGAVSKERRSTTTGRRVGYTPHKAIAEQLLGIDWMTLDEC